MSTSDKLTYLNTTKDKLKTTINYTGANITNDTFRSYPEKLYNQYVDLVTNGTDTLYSNLPKITGEGTSLTLNNTKAGKMELTYKGNTYQYSTTGKNKFSTDFKTTDNLTTYTKIDSNSFSFTCSGTWKGATFVVPCKENTDYYFNYAKKVDGTYCYIKGTQTNTDLMAKYYGYFNSFNSGANTTLTITISNGNNSNITSDTIYNIQLEEGTTTTSFEKYSGGSPSPSPSYPQEIHNVSGDNTIEICGKNLLNKEIYELGKYIGANGSIVSNVQNFLFSDYSIVSPNTEYTISANTEMKNFVIAEYDSSKTWLKNTTKSLVQSSSFTTDSNTKYVRVSCNYNYQAITKEIIDTLNIQLEKGNQSSAYTPYVSQTQLISLGVLELCKIGNYQDYIYKTDKWYLHKETGKVVLNENSDIATHPNGTNSYETLLGNLLISNSVITIISDYFKGVSWNNRTSGNDIIYGISENGTKAVVRNTTFTSLSDFKNWLSVHNVSIYYMLATPTYTEITDTTLLGQLEAIKYSYDGQTNVSQSNNDLPFILDVSAIKEYE